MKCPHCGQEHPDNTKFCPETGKKLEQQFLFCDNPDCDFRQPLPPTANFCPNCGWTLNSQDNTPKRTHFSSISLTATIVLKDEFGRCKLIDSKGNPLDDKSFQIVSQDYLDNDDADIKEFVAVHNSKAYFVTNDGHFYDLGTYDDQQDMALVSVCDRFVLFLHNRFAILYKKDSEQGLITLSQFRLKYGIQLFFVIGDYISFVYENGIASINIKTGEKLTIPGYKYSMLLAIRGDEPIFLATNRAIDDDDFWVVGRDGNIIQSFSKGVYWPIGYSNCLIRNYGKTGLVSSYGEEIIPPYFDRIDVNDESYFVLHLGKRFGGTRIIEFDLKNRSFITEHYWGGKVICREEELPSTIEDLDEILKTYGFGFGCSSDYFVHNNNEIVRRVDQRVIYEMDEHEYPIGASDRFKMFGIYDREYLSIYDNDGKLLKEFHQPKGIINPHLYADGIILFFDNEGEELSVINVDFKLITIHNSSHFNGISDVISSNCIAVQLLSSGEQYIWKLYSVNGELILPEETNVLSWKKLSEQYVVLDTANYHTMPNLGLSEKKGILLNLQDNSFVTIPYTYESAFVLKSAI